MTRYMLFVLLVLGVSTVQACDYGFFGENCDQNATACATERCSGHGVCTSATFGCECNIFFYNTSSCNLNRTQCRIAQCNDHGECTLDTGICSCDSLYFGDTTCSVCVDGFSLASNCTQCVADRYGSLCSWNATECGLYQCNAHGDCRANETDCLCQSAWNASANCGETRCNPLESVPLANGSACLCRSPFGGEPDHCILACSYPAGLLVDTSTGQCECSPSRAQPLCRDVLVSVPVLSLTVLTGLGLILIWSSAMLDRVL
jgi:hypothetical protein